MIKGKKGGCVTEEQKAACDTGEEEAASDVVVVDVGIKGG